MQINIMVGLERFEAIQKQGFDQALGYWFWNTGVMIAPMDTGNLRSSILLAKNKPRHIKISYNTFMANYIQFLEEGQGPVKKYKNFIKGDTAQAITEQLVSWIITGNVPSMARYALKPFVVLKGSNHKPFSAERALLKQANMNTNVISAKARMQISKIREMNYNGNTQRITGQKITTYNAKGTKSTNRNISHLQTIYNERRKQITG
jgi:hypothetical protein